MAYTRRRFQSPYAEATVQEHVCDYLRMKYPRVIFRSDFASGMKLSMNQAVRHKRLQSSRAWPDLFIYAPVGGYQGLALELKAEGFKVYKQDGTLRKDAHLAEQMAMLERLDRIGYKATFACGFNQARQAIDDYLSLAVHKVELGEVSVEF